VLVLTEFFDIQISFATAESGLFIRPFSAVAKLDYSVGAIGKEMTPWIKP